MPEAIDRHFAVFASECFQTSPRRNEIRHRPARSRVDRQTGVAPDQKARTGDQVVSNTEQQQNVVDGYELKSCISMGKMSAVWEVVPEGGGDPMAMKLLLPEGLADSSIVAALKHEYKVGSSLQHPNIIRMHKCSARRKHAYILMDLFRSLNLKQFMKVDLVGVQTRLKRIFEQLAMALAFMHEKGWIHKDVKPDNVLVTRASELRLIDFSLAARSAGALGKLLGGKKVIQGTRTYIAPEIIRRQAPTPQTDMYSFGVTLFEVLTGKPPFTGATPTELLKMHLAMPAPVPSAWNPNVTPEMDRLVFRLLAKKPKERPKTFQEILNELRSIQPFKEPPEELQKEEQSETAEEERLFADASRVDSRADVARQELMRKNPELARKILEERERRKREQEAKRLARIRALEREEARTGKTPEAPQTAPQQPAPTAPAAVPPGFAPPFAGPFPPPAAPPGFPGAAPPPPAAPPFVPPGAAVPPPYAVPPGAPPPFVPAPAPPTGTMPPPAAVPPGAVPPAGTIPPTAPTAPPIPAPSDAGTPPAAPQAQPPAGPISPQSPPLAPPAHPGGPQQPPVGGTQPPAPPTPPQQRPDDQKKQEPPDDDLPLWEELPEVI
ncbi:MAG: serine/threonine protein kinase [Planctomycetota bacterium]|nr:MAG: serine/threonine protein kinase [Planctomycetota bacterium]